jgi:hypothetical protein
MSFHHKPQGGNGSRAKGKGFIHDQSLEGKLLARLREAKGAWVPARELSNISLAYCARVWSLRRLQGLNIQNKVETRSGARLGFYRLIESLPTIPRGSQGARDAGKELNLFLPSELEGARRYSDPEESFR